MVVVCVAVVSLVVVCVVLAFWVQVCVVLRYCLLAYAALVCGSCSFGAEWFADSLYGAGLCDAGLGEEVFEW